MVREVFKVYAQNRVQPASFSSAERISERIVEQNVDIPVSGGGLHVLPDPGGSSSSAVSRDERGDVFFGLFPG